MILRFHYLVTFFNIYIYISAPHNFLGTPVSGFNCEIVIYDWEEEKCMLGFCGEIEGK